MREIFATIAILALTSAPAQAQDEERGLSLMERGAQMFLDGIMREMEPAMKDLQGLAEEMEPALRGFLDEMGPAFAELLGQIEDFSAYHAPEMLPNGDIILRKKRPDEMIADPSEEDIEI